MSINNIDMICALLFSASVDCHSGGMTNVLAENFHFFHKTKLSLRLRMQIRSFQAELLCRATTSTVYSYPGAFGSQLILKLLPLATS